MTASRSAILAGRAAALALALVLPGCAGLYFRPADAPAAPVQYELSQLPFSEYWTGIVFNGEKIGFSRFSIRAVSREPLRYEIDSEASFVLRFLTIEKKVNLKARDMVRPDLTLVEFAYDYHIDGSHLSLKGKREASQLAATIVSGGKPTEQRLPVDGKLYPSSVIALYPVVHGLALGREYNYRVYNGEIQALADVSQRVQSHEKSEFFTGNAFKVETRMRGQRVTTWIDHQGRPAFELALHGVMISALEEPGTARRYVALASLNKNESLVEFSLIRPQAPIERPREVSALKVVLQGAGQLPPSDEMQRCSRTGRDIECEIRRVSARAEDDAQPAAQTAHARYLSPSVTVQSNDPAIRRTAQEIIAGSTSRGEHIARIVQWLQNNVERVPLDVFSALDVLEKRKAECQGHAYLYTAFARAVGIPTRVVNGLAYSQDLQGFFYHSWTESLVGTRWVPIDPTFGQTAADATHIKLLEGESLADLLPLTEWVGKTRIRVLAVEHEKPETLSSER